MIPPGLILLLAAFYLVAIAWYIAGRARAMSRPLARPANTVERILEEPPAYDDDGQVLYMDVATPAGEVEIRQYVTMPDGSRQLFPPLPDGVEEYEVKAWLNSIWYSRKDPPRSPHKITLSERGAVRHSLTRRWSKDQVAAVKQWAIDRGWFEITNEERGNTRITGWGRRALRTMAAPDGPSLRVVACLTPPPADDLAANDTDGLELRTARRARNHARAGEPTFVPTPIGRERRDN